MADKENRKGFFKGMIDRFKASFERSVEESEKEKTEEKVEPEVQIRKESSDKIAQTQPETPQPQEKLEPEKERQEKKQKAVEETHEGGGGFLDKLKPSNWFEKLKDGLEKTRKSFVFKMTGLFRLRNVIDEEFWEDLEDILIAADVGIPTTEFIVDEMQKAVDEHYISEPSSLLDKMKEELESILEEKSTHLDLAEEGLSIIMVVGVNGTGKTTSIAKLANRFMQEGKKVIIAAADTFRAAAIEQLEVWGRKLDLDVIKHEEHSDPAAVVFDAISAARARKADVLLIDTAGRLHSKVNLMKELEKIKRVIKRNYPDAPHETLLVLDATTGQNAMIQAKTFSQFVDVTGIILTKLDGTAKGGIIIGIMHELGIPVKYIGIGEGVYDLRPFSARYFLDALFAEDERENTPETMAS